MAQLTVVNREGEVVADDVAATNFMAFKRQCGKGSALLVELDCGEEIMVDTVKLFRKLPRDVAYRARLLRRTMSPPEVSNTQVATYGRRLDPARRCWQLPIPQAVTPAGSF